MRILEAEGIRRVEEKTRVCLIFDYTSKNIYFDNADPYLVHDKLRGFLSNVTIKRDVLTRPERIHLSVKGIIGFTVYGFDSVEDLLERLKMEFK